MKIWGALSAVLVIVASPSAAQTVAQDEATITNLVGNFTLIAACQSIGFQANKDSALEAAEAPLQRLHAKGVKDFTIDLIVSKAGAAHQHIAMLDAMSAYQSGSPDPAASVQKIMSGYDELQQQCDALSDAPETRAILTRTGYQATREPKSYLAWLQYQADAGDVEKFGMISDIYTIGALPDPDHLKSFDAASKGASMGDPASADNLAADYFLAVGTPADHVQAVKWGVIAKALGISDSWNHMEPMLKPDERTQGEAMAQDWLTAHGH